MRARIEPTFEHPKKGEPSRTRRRVLTAPDRKAVREDKPASVKKSRAGACAPVATKKTKTVASGAKRGKATPVAKTGKIPSGKARTGKAKTGKGVAARVPSLRGSSRKPAKPSTFLERVLGVERRRRWRRTVSDWRRNLDRIQPFLLFVTLSVITLIFYGLWVSGVLDRGVQAMGRVGGGALVGAGLKMENITVDGLQVVSRADFDKALAAEAGQPLLDFDTAGARERLEALSWIRSANVMRLLPDRLHVDVVERKAYALWQSAKTFYLIDDEGVVLEPLQEAGIARYAHLPRVVGEGANIQASKLLAILDTVPVLKSRLLAASRVADRRWNLLLDNGIEVRLPDTDVARAIGDIAELDAKHRLLARKISMIDLRNPDVLVVRPAEDAGDADTMAQTLGGAGRRVVTKRDR